MIKLSDKIEKNNHFNTYCYDYKTLTCSLPIDFELGKNLKNSNKADETLNNFITERNAVCIFTDGSKIKDKQAVGSAVFCSDLNIEIKKSIDA